MRRALITGVAGQDGAYLAQFLLARGYEVYGFDRGLVGGDLSALEQLGVGASIVRIKGDITDGGSLRHLLSEIRPHEVYNLAAQSRIKASWDQPLLTGEVTGLGAARLLDAIRLDCPEARFFQASSSAMYGEAGNLPHSEDAPFRSNSPYAAAKIYAHWMAVNYRESFGLFTSCGIMFNHDSPLRAPDFVSRKITDGVARIKLGLHDELRLGNVHVQRDWGHARDYVRAMWLMLQQPEPDDFVIATGRSVSVLDLCRIAFDYVGLNAEDHVAIDTSQFRPTEVWCLRGDASKARRKLGWVPEISLETMIAEMVEADLERLRQQVHDGT